MEACAGQSLLVNDASMVSMEKLAARMPRPKRVVLVGDVDQLPPLGETSLFPQSTLPPCSANAQSELLHSIQAIQRGSADLCEDNSFSCVWVGAIVVTTNCGHTPLSQFICFKNETRCTINAFV